MNRRLLPLVVIAFAVSGASTMLLYKLVVPRVSAKPDRPPQRTVVAARMLEPGTLVREADIRVQPFSGTPPDGVARAPQDVLGRGVVATIYAGEPVHEGRLAPKGAGAGLAALIPTGMRAVAVKVNEVVGVAGFVLPGMRVDVLIAGRPPNPHTQETGTVSRTLLQNVQVLSAGERLHKDADGKPVQAPVVSLLVTPEQAEMLSLAGTETRIQLVLRSPLDMELAKPPGTAVSKLFGGAAPAVSATAPRRRRAPAVPQPPPIRVAAQKPEPYVVEMLHGAKRSETRF